MGCKVAMLQSGKVAGLHLPLVCDALGERVASIENVTEEKVVASKIMLPWQSP